MRSLYSLRPTALSRRLVRKMLAAKVPLIDSAGIYALFGLCPGRHQKAAGAWAWQLYQQQKDGQWNPIPVGGCDPATLIVRKDHKVDFYRNRWTGDIDVFGEKS